MKIALVRVELQEVKAIFRIYSTSLHRAEDKVIGWYAV